MLYRFLTVANAIKLIACNAKLNIISIAKLIFVFNNLVIVAIYKKLILTKLIMDFVLLNVKMILVIIVRFSVPYIFYY